MSTSSNIYEKMLKYYEKMLQSEEIIDKSEIEQCIKRCRIEIQKSKYGKCSHLWVSLPSEDIYEDRRFGCVKCGFTNSFISKFNNIYDELNEEEIASFEHMTMSFYANPGIHSESWCDLELGKAIYKKIIQAHPEASDEEIANYLSYALWKMRTKDQSGKRKLSRVRRLGLKHDFNAWTEYEQD